MKQTKLLLLILAMLMPMIASADAIEINGLYYNLIKKGNVAELTSNPSKYTGDVVIPEKITHEDIEYSVISIGSSAFSGCSELISVAIPSSVTSIGGSAFYNCKNLNSLTIPNSVTSIGDVAFCGCEGLKSITIPNKITTISADTFHGCSGLTSVNIPNGVTSIGSYAFAYCKALTSISIPNSVTSISYGAFHGCSRLNSINIPESVSSIGGQAFDYCSSLTSIIIPNNVLRIERATFCYCSELTSVTIGKGLISLRGSAFANCTKLTDVYCLPEQVPYTESDAFTDSYPEYITLHVPAASIEAYKASEPWSGFKEIVAIENTKFTLTYEVDGEEYKSYELVVGSNITPEAEPTKDGYVFSGWSDIPSTMPAHDVTITGTFAQYYKCTIPTIVFENGKLTFNSETEGVEYHYTIQAEPISNTGNNVIVDFPQTALVSVYATKEGYEDSDVATKEIDIHSLKGDVNGDGKVTVTDAVEVMDIILMNE